MTTFYDHRHPDDITADCPREKHWTPFEKQWFQNSQSNLSLCSLNANKIFLICL